MRIIAGSLRGRSIHAPRGRIARPMRDQVREALFQQLGDAVQGARVLDVFSGSGSLGLEALSRGASWVCFCEKAAACRKVIARNLSELELTDRARVAAVDLARGLDFLDGEAPCEVVVMDPPFDLLRRPPGPGQVDVRALLAAMARSSSIACGAAIAFETPSRSFRIDGELAAWGLELEHRREYGSTALWLVRKPAGPAAPPTGSPRDR